MEPTPQSHFKQTEAIKLFHLVQQVIPDTGNLIRAKDLQKLVLIWRENQNFSLSVLNQLNPEGKDLT